MAAAVVATAAVTVTIDNSPPVVSVLTPSAPFAGTTLFELGVAEPHSTITQVEFFVGGASVGVDTDLSDGYWLNWNSTACRAK